MIRDKTKYHNENKEDVMYVSDVIFGENCLYFLPHVGKSCELEPKHQ